MNGPVGTIAYITILIFSVVIHEVAHGYAADALGDKTARHSGRLTLNPIPHLDLFGSVILPALLVLSGTGIVFGWAKPVPFNLRNIKDQKWGPSLIALAGPASNLLLALIFGLAVRFAQPLSFSLSMVFIFSTVAMVNITLAIFNLIPVPPLDGHHVLFSFLSSYKYARLREVLQKNSLILILVVIFFAWELISPLIFGLFKLITGMHFF